VSEYITYHSFSEIHKFHKKILNIFSAYVPKFPKKFPKMFISHSEKVFIENRIISLQFYFDNLINVVKIFSNKEFLRFFGIDNIGLNLCTLRKSKAHNSTKSPLIQSPYLKKKFSNFSN
jgi:hypothetical protein